MARIGTKLKRFGKGVIKFIQKHGTGLGTLAGVASGLLTKSPDQSALGHIITSGSIGAAAGTLGKFVSSGGK